MFYVYILRSEKDQSLYIGYTRDLNARFKSHNQRKNLATKYKVPYKLLYYEAFVNKVDAKHREVYLKSGWGLRSIKKILRKTFENDD